MSFDFFEQESAFFELWNSVKIARSIPYTLFTFGNSSLEYYLIVEPKDSGQLVKVSRGKINISRPTLITPFSSNPDFADFFEEEDLSGVFNFLLARTAAFKNLKIENQQQKVELTSDSVEEVVTRLSQKLDSEGEDRVAILTAPARLGPLAVLKYTTNRVLESAPGNIRELREKGFLPE